MNTRSWMSPETTTEREHKPRTSGRRKQDRRLRMETILGAAVVLAWGWGVYELTLLFLR
jgi:hypothetical protein